MMPEFTPEELHECAKRELTMRRSVYPAWVYRGKMTQAQADREIAMMERIAEDYRPADLFGKANK